MRDEREPRLRQAEAPARKPWTLPVLHAVPTSRSGQMREPLDPMAEPGLEPPGLR